MHFYLMSEWLDSQRKPSSKFRKLLQGRIENANPRRTLSTEETKRLAKLEAMADKLKRRENVRIFSYKLGLAKASTYK